MTYVSKFVPVSILVVLRHGAHPLFVVQRIPIVVVVSERCLSVPGVRAHEHSRESQQTVKHRLKITEELIRP